MGIFGLGKTKKTSIAKMRAKEAGLIREERKNLILFSKDFYMLEAYKTLRTNVNFSLTNDVNGGYVIAVSSALQSEGKSFNAINLAMSYVEIDKKVLLVDCDLRRPKISRLLSIKSDVGLSNVLAFPDLMEDAIIHSSIPNLDVIHSGDIPPNPSELLSSPRMDKLLETLRQRYDMIILDTPPVNMVTDTAVLSRKIDGILFVVRAGQTERQALMQAIDQLEYAQAKILGFVLNGVDKEREGYRYKKYRYKYGYRYGYGYGYGYSNQLKQESEKKDD